MIPKIIHFCWFGEKPIPPKFLKYIDSWKHLNPNYAFIKWDESNYDIQKSDFTSNAYANKQYAFVSDYARLDVLSQMGGIYLDTDEEVIKNFDDLLDYDAFFGFESIEYVQAGVIGVEKESLIINEFLQYYDHYKPQPDADKPLTIPVVISDVLEKKGLKRNGATQRIEENIIVFNKEYFSPINLLTGEKCITKNTYTIHHASASWYTPKMKIKSKLAKLLRRILGVNNFNKIVKAMKIKGNI